MLPGSLAGEQAGERTERCRSRRRSILLSSARRFIAGCGLLHFGPLSTYKTCARRPKCALWFG
jgi:hypothetical protein